MENKYFLPDWKDITLEGYELELATPNGWVTGVFPSVLEKNRELDECTPDDLQKLAHAVIRVPYLTKEQIEAEGWFFCNILIEDDETDYDIIVEGFMLNLSEDHWFQMELLPDHQIKIMEKYYENELSQIWRMRYDGPCPSINEFRTLCKWFKIK